MENSGELLRGQKALVTGASSGIGRAIALKMGEAGACVVVNHIGDSESAADLVRDIQDRGGAALAIEADVSNEDQVRQMFREMFDRYGTIDILVNNAGIQQDSPFLEMSLDRWKSVLDVNLTGSFLCAKEAAREFKRKGIVEDVSRAAGKIIFISSVHEIIPWAGHCNYAASKGGMMLFMKTIAQELAGDRIRINSIAPGAIKTPINREVWSNPTERRRLLELIPYNRIGEPSDIASVAVWLASDQADYIHGTTIVVDGGMCLFPGFRTGG